MSNQTNDILFERAAEMIDYFQGKLPARLIEQDLEHDDLEALAEHVNQAEGLAAQQEMYNYDSY